MGLPRKKVDESRTKILALAREVLAIEANAVAALAERLDQDFIAAVDLVLGHRGRVVVSGVGKSRQIYISTRQSSRKPARSDSLPPQALRRRSRSAMRSRSRYWTLAVSDLRILRIRIRAARSAEDC
jgi:hypothetical protein